MNTINGITPRNDGLITSFLAPTREEIANGDIVPRINTDEIPDVKDTTKDIIHKIIYN